MATSLVILGLILDIIGISILVVVVIWNPWHTRREDFKWHDKERYSWQSWRPFYKNTQTLKWITKWDRIVSVHGFIPIKHQLNIIGFLLILIGFIFQLKFYLS